MFSQSDRSADRETENSGIEERVERLTKMWLYQLSRNKVDWPPSED